MLHREAQTNSVGCVQVLPSPHFFAKNKIKILTIKIENYVLCTLRTQKKVI